MQTASGGTIELRVIKRRILLYDALSTLSDIPALGNFFTLTNLFSIMLAYVSSPLNQVRCSSFCMFLMSEDSLYRRASETDTGNIFNFPLRYSSALALSRSGI